MMREPFKKTLETGDSFNLHPAFASMDIVSVTEKEALVGLDREFNVYKTPAANEFATYPAVKSIRVKIGFNIEVKSKKGVTVRELCKAIGRAWDTELPRHLAILPGMTYRSALSDRNGWIDWEEEKVTSYGGALLSADPNNFDS